MKRLWERLEGLLAAVAFAEEGDFETARRLAAPDAPRAPENRPEPERHEPPSPAVPRPSTPCA